MEEPRRNIFKLLRWTNPGTTRLVSTYNALREKTGSFKYTDTFPGNVWPCDFAIIMANAGTTGNCCSRPLKAELVDSVTLACETKASSCRFRWSLAYFHTSTNFAKVEWAFAFVQNKHVQGQIANFEVVHILQVRS